MTNPPHTTISHQQEGFPVPKEVCNEFRECVSKIKNHHIHPLPSGVQPQAIIALLHDHEAYIRTTCPQLITYKRLSGPSISVRAPVGEPCTFEVTDRRPTAVIGQKTTYKLTITNQADGVDALVEGKAPTGSMVIKTRWRVRGDGGGSDGDDIGGNALREEVEIDSNMITKKMVRGNIEKGHPEYHRSFLAQAGKGKEVVVS